MHDAARRPMLELPSHISQILDSQARLEFDRFHAPELKMGSQKLTINDAAITED